MPYKFFIIPVLDAAQAEEEMNRFLRSQRVINILKELVQHEGAVFWSFCVEYMDGFQSTASGKIGSRGRADRVDYRAVLSEADFAVYSKLRELRRKLADAEAIPVYAICTNEQLAEMAKRRVSSPAGFQEIEGIGEAKAARYGKAFLEVLSPNGGELQ